MNRPEVHDVLRRWRQLADAHDPPRVLVGETYVLDLDPLIPYYGKARTSSTSRSTSSSCTRELEAEALRTIVEGVEAKLPRSPGRSTPDPTTTPAGSRPAGRATTSAAPASRC